MSNVALADRAWRTTTAIYAGGCARRVFAANAPALACVLTNPEAGAYSNTSLAEVAIKRLEDVAPWLWQLEHQLVERYDGFHRAKGFGFERQ